MNAELLPAPILPPGGNSYRPSSKSQVLRLIFLDIDGVLNSYKTQVVYGTVPFPLNVCDKGGRYVRDAFSTDFLAAGLVNNLCEHTGALIVLSSTWRLNCSLYQLGCVLNELGINSDYLVGRTRDSSGTLFKGSRGDEIQDFLDMVQNNDDRQDLIEEGLLDLCFSTVEKVKIETYVIIDDVPDMLESQKKHNFVQTTFMEGLTCALAIEAGKILTNDETFYLNGLQGKPSAGEKH